MPADHLDPVTGLAALLCIAAGAGAAGALNMWCDAGVNALMPRIALRPIPRGRVSRRETLAFGLPLAISAVAILGLAANMEAAALLAFTIVFYVAVSILLKRRTAQNIVIGGAAGAFPPVIGWVAAAGRLDLEPTLFFLIIFYGRRRISGHSRSIAPANMPMQGSRCCQLSLARRKRSARY